MSIFVLLLCYMLFVTPLGFLRDGAAARHIACGQYMLSHGAPATTNFLWLLDPQAFWNTHELFTDFIFAFLYDTAHGEYQYMVLAAAVAMSAAIALAAKQASLEEAPKLFVGLATVLATLATSIHWSCRAHIFSYVFFVLAICLLRSNLDLKKKSLCIFLDFVLWINFHGSAILGLPLVILSKIESGNDLAVPLKTRIIHWLCLAAAALLGMSCSLRGPAYFGFLGAYAGQGQILGQGSEWAGFDTAYGIGTWAFIALIVLNLIARFKSNMGKSILNLESLLPTFLLLGFSAAALLAMRILPYAALLALATLAPSVAPAKRVLKYLTPMLLGATVAILAAFACTQHIGDMHPAFLPVRCTDYLKAHPPASPVGFCYDNWGDYIYIKTGLKYFIDDRTEFYPKDFNVAYRAALMADPGAKDFLKESKFSYILIPTNSPLAALLKEDSDYQIVERDLDALLFYSK